MLIDFPDYEDDDEDDFLVDEDDFDCGYIRGEGCLLAGTEECDFECPYRNVLYGRVDSSPIPPVDPIPF